MIHTLNLHIRSSRQHICLDEIGPPVPIVLISFNVVLISFRFCVVVLISFRFCVVIYYFADIKTFEPFLVVCSSMAQMFHFA